MKSSKAYLYSLIGPLMILLAIIGIIFRNERKKIFYYPIGITGIYLIAEKEFNRQNKRKIILKKIQSFRKDK